MAVLPTTLSNMDMVLAKSDMASASLRVTRFQRLRAEWQSSIDMLLAITGHEAPLEQNPLLARSIRNLFPYSIR